MAVRGETDILSKRTATAVPDDMGHIREAATMSEHVYKHLQLTGSSKVSIEDAVAKAIAKASDTVRNIGWFKVTDTRGHVVDGKVDHWQVTIDVGFRLED